MSENDRNYACVKHGVAVAWSVTNDVSKAPKCLFGHFDGTGSSEQAQHDRHRPVVDDSLRVARRTRSYVGNSPSRLELHLLTEVKSEKKEETVIRVQHEEP